MATTSHGTEFYREWARDVNRRRGTMCTLDAIDVISKTYNPGYASVYMFDHAAAAEVLKNGHSRNLDRYKVYSDRLVIDLDGGAAQLERTMEVLNREGLAYEVWRSGGKGFHVLIPHEFVGSKDLPYSHLNAVKKLGLECDESLYQHGRIISLPGRVHPKTKKKKEFHMSVEGKPLDLEIVQRPAPVFNFEERTDHEALKTGLLYLACLAEQEPFTGNRHMALWRCAKDLAEAGLEYDTVLNLLTEVNNSWQNPKEPEEVEQAVRGAFKKSRLIAKSGRS